MSIVKLRETQPGLATAIRTLRERLGDTQEGMARRLGCTLSGYIQWEKGRRIPGGDWLLRLMALCPDEETRNLFESPGELVRKPAPIFPSRVRNATPASSTTPQQRREARAMAREAIDILYEIGQAGFRPADQKLKYFADELSRVAGDFSRAFPRPK